MSIPQITRLTAVLRTHPTSDSVLGLTGRAVLRITGDFDAILTDQIIGPTLSDTMPTPCLAVHAPRGTYDIERASLALRLIEAKRGLQDGVIPLMAFLFPHLAALADRSFGLHHTPRLIALALDELPLSTSSSGPAYGEDPAAVIYARARLVANARQIGVPALLFVEAHDAGIQMRAECDGFDGFLMKQALG